MKDYNPYDEPQTMAQVRRYQNIFTPISGPVVKADLLKGGWRRVPSVTAGGKKFFYFKCEPYRQWIVWDRKLKRWVYQEEKPL